MDIRQELIFIMTINNWTPNEFLYRKFLSKHAKTSGRNNADILDVFEHYKHKGVYIESVCKMGADIMNFQDTFNMANIKIEFQYYAIVWFNELEKLFGIHIHSRYPRLMICNLGVNTDFFNCVCPEIDTPTYYRQHKGYVFPKHIQFNDIEHVFYNAIGSYL